jgi:hypothetical protein
MATWHQKNGPHYTHAYSANRLSYVLVEDPYNGLCTRMTFDTRAEAEAYIERRVNVFKNARREDFTIVAPATRTHANAD